MKQTKIIPISDLHLDSAIYHLNISKDDADIVVFSGDIGNKFQAMKIILPLLEKGIIVIYVLGNHEFYNINNQVKTIQEIIDGWKEREKKHKNFYVLNNESIIINNIKFIGTTGWSKLSPELYSKEEVNNVIYESSDFNKIMMSKLMKGYRVIRGYPITIDDYQDLHQKAIDYISSEIKKDFSGKKFLISHYPLTTEGIKEDETGKFISELYHSDYDDMITNSNLDYYLYGHIHTSIDIMKKGVRYICNAYGYRKYNEHNPKFSEQLTIHVTED